MGGSLRRVDETVRSPNRTSRSSARMTSKKSKSKGNSRSSARMTSKKGKCNDRSRSPRDTTPENWLVVALAADVGFLHVGAGFVHGALGIVVGLDGEAVFVDGALALVRAVEDAAQFDVAPDFGPLGVAVAAQGVAESVGGRLVVLLHKEDFAQAIVGQRAGFVGVERLLVLGYGGDQVALGYLLLAAQDGDADGEVGRGFQQPVVRVDGDVAGSAEGFNSVLRLVAGEVDAAVFGLAFGLNPQLDRHTEQVEVLGDGADRAESLVIAQAQDGVFVAEARRAGAVDPLRKEGGEFEFGLRFGDGLNVRGADGLVGVLGEDAA